MKEKVIEAKIADLHPLFYVRQKLDDDYVLTLASMIEGGVELEPIRITRDMGIIDGRHRIAAHDMNNLLTIKAVVEDVGDDFLALMARAVSYNVGGSLPQTRQDLELIMSQLIEKGVSYNKIVQTFSPLFPKTMIRAAHAHASWGINQKKVQRAIALIVEKGANIDAASQVIGIDKKAIEEALMKRKERIEARGNGQWLGEQKRTIGNQFTRFNKVNGRYISSIFKEYDSGEITLQDAENFFGYVGKLVSNVNHIWVDWEKRWNGRKRQPKEKGPQ